MIAESLTRHQTTSEGTGLIVIAGNGTVLYHNRIAKGLIKRKDALLLSGDRLGFTDPEIEASFYVLLGQLMTPPLPGSGTEGHLKIGASGGDSEYSLQLSGMIGRDNFVETVLIQVIRMTPIVEVEPQSRPSQVRSLRHLYELTPAESKVCEAMYRLGSLERARSEIGISRNTIRSHLSNVFSKLNVSSQGELMKALAQNNDSPAHSMDFDDQVQAIAH